MKMKINRKGFVQIPILIAIIVGILVTGGGGYFGFKQYQNYQTEKERTVEEAQKQKNLEIERLKQEVEALKGEEPQTMIKEAPSQEITGTPPSFKSFKESFKESSIRYISEETALHSLIETKPGENIPKQPPSSSRYTSEGTTFTFTFIKTLRKGTEVRFITEKELLDNWSKILVDSQEGWVESRYLTEERPFLPNLSDVIKKWRSFVAYIECDFRDLNTHELYDQAYGSGVVRDFDGQITIITSRHLIVDDYGYQPYSCRAKLPDDTKIFTGQKFTGGAPLDIGFIYISNPDEYVRNLTFLETSNFRYCKVKPSLGDDILILGYPSIGSQTDITATEGIISGYDGDYFITSAKIERGNSGGAAILVNDDCYLGIPSFAKAGNIESLSRILDINAVFKY